MKSGNIIIIGLLIILIFIIYKKYNDQFAGEITSSPSSFDNKIFLILLQFACSFS